MPIASNYKENIACILQSKIEQQILKVTIFSQHLFPRFMAILSYQIFYLVSYYLLHHSSSSLIFRIPEISTQSITIYIFLFDSI